MVHPEMLHGTWQHVRQAGYGRHVMNGVHHLRLRGRIWQGLGRFRFRFWR